METLIPNKSLEVATPSGWKPFSGIRLVDAERTLKILFEDGRSIVCTFDHIFVDGEREISASDLSSGDLLSDREIFSIEELSEKRIVADLYQVDGSVYFTNGFISHNCSFEKSGNTVIDADTIEWYERNLIRDPMSKVGFDHNMWVWKEPEVGKNYIISADVARGDGADFSTIEVFCVEDLEQVAEYKGKLPPGTFGDMLVEVGKKYNEGMIICENNNIGFAAIQRVLDTMYPKVYWSKKTEGQLFFDPLNWHIPGPDKIPGFQTTGKSRPLLISNYEEMLRTRQFKFYSSRLLNEVKGFIWVNTGMQVKAQAADGMNDDLVMALAIGLFGRNTTLRLTSSDTVQTNALLDSIMVEKGRHSISGVSIQQETIQTTKHPYIFGNEDLSWMLG